VAPEIKPQFRNANRHTQRGMAALEKSIATDGWIGAITVAADWETFDGSARVEKTAENGMLDEAIVVDSDGSKPIIVRRVDIPSATDPRAKRLGVAANRIPLLNFDTDPGVLAGIAAEVDLSGLYFPDELALALEAAGTELIDVEFKEYDESVENEVKYCACPACGHRFPA
jgi:hypothetical protein